MKKIFSVLLAGMLLLTMLAACKGSETPSSSEPETSVSEPANEPETPESETATEPTSPEAPETETSEAASDAAGEQETVSEGETADTSDAAALLPAQTN